MNQSHQTDTNLSHSDRCKYLHYLRSLSYDLLIIYKLGNPCFKGLLAFAVILAQIPLIITTSQPAFADHGVCATPGLDGVTNADTVINTYYSGGVTGAVASSGQTSLTIGSANGQGANIPIAPGDMLMIIQMQDATIDPDNDATYGSGNAANDGSGATTIGNSGLYEFVRATNSVPITGGTLEFEGGGAAGGLQNTYVNAAPTATQGRRTFQVVRVPQFATLTLGADLAVPDWDGTSGGVLAMDVAGSINFNGFSIDGSAKGFRGGFTPSGPSGINIADYAVNADPAANLAGGKGEGIAGTPRFTWDGTSANDLGSDQLPGGDAGRGAPGNAGGGGNDHNSGGGGGGNGGSGGLGGIGWEGAGFQAPANNTDNTPGGRGGAVPTSPTITRLIMGGGGGGGDANNEQNGVRGGQGGGIVMIRAGEFIGSGTIRVNGSDGEQGEDDGAPDGAGGGGAGGTVALIAESGNLAGITVEAQGGDGGNTINDNNNEHGPGGAGAGGVVISYSPGGQVGSVDVTGGEPGRANSGNGIAHGTESGDGGVGTLAVTGDIPPILSGSECFPTLEVTKIAANPGEPGERVAPNTAEYSITVSNTEHGGASEVKINDTLPTGFSYASGATAVLTGGATGPTNPTNAGTATEPVFGDYLIPSGGSVTITLEVDIAANTPSGVYQNPAYATYLDPSRNTPGRLITPATGANAGDNTTYEGGIVAGQAVPGSNYVSSSSTAEDVHIAELTLPCPTARADLWFANDESGSVSSAEFNNALDFIYQISDQFEYGEAAGMKAGIIGWAFNTPTAATNNIIIPITDTFSDSDDTGLIADSNISTDGDNQGVREEYTAKADLSNGTRLDRATNYLADLIIAGTVNGRRANTPQVAIILTDASSSQITNAGSGGGINWIFAADKLKSNAEATIVLIIIDEAADAYNNSITAQQTIDAVVGDNGQLLVVPTYTEAADATQGYVSQAAQSVCDSSNPIATDPEVLLTKRITAINPETTDQVSFTDFVDDSSDSDNNEKWPNSSGDADTFTNTYTVGEIDGGEVLPGDVLEYTIYFLSSGDEAANEVLVCDLVPANTEFVTNDFDDFSVVSPAAGGTTGIDRGLVWDYNGNIESLTNDNDGDAGYYFPPGVEPSTVFPDIKCSDSNLPNTNGAVVVDLGNVTQATASGDPIGSFGFIRFRAKVK
ncbi:MAG: hypothetical protein AAGE84_18570 [Cyanobacteria bacterium P01_G01_bin.39]